MDQNRLIPYGAKDAHFEHAAREGLPLGRVICQERLLYTVISEEGEILLAVTGRFRQSAAHPGEYPVAGDWVLFSERGIEKVLPRSGFLARVAAGNDPYRQPVAANMDVLFVCMPADSTYNRLKLERFLAAAAGSGARPVLLITKADLCADIGGLLADARALAAGADVVACTSSRPDGFDGARAYLGPGVTAALIGASGAGKSTLVNALAGTDIETQAVRQDGKGRHTTTRRELILLPRGGALIDTPGMRSFSLDDSDVASAFPEIDALARNCRFRDCAHGAEPGCAVRAALARGELDARRLRSYLKLHAEEERRARAVRRAKR
ncbi:MAG: putative ribosome biogenesis GTPase RsgA [Firmicutes bacterium ADurb.Bin248]|nr:MAG: putative ribosome biogenesis GTPase RsgA [Firmicutes bacterium ADurb.Bin248]HPK16105.1 ribosome small subunit-dependent GTPase A [Clostridia bacterium]